MNIKIKMRTKIKFKKVELSVTCILTYISYVAIFIYFRLSRSLSLSTLFFHPSFAVLIPCHNSFFYFLPFPFFSFLFLSFDIYLNSLPLLHFFSFLSSILLLLLLLIHPIFLPSFHPFFLLSFATIFFLSCSSPSH